MNVRKQLYALVIIVVAFVFQVVVAPYIAINSITPNVVAVASMLVAVTRGNRAGCIMPFIVGLLYNLILGGPVGAMALCLVLCAYSASRLLPVLHNDTAFIPLVLGSLFLLAVELLYGIIMLLSGDVTSVVDALLLRCFPSFLYDVVLFIVLYPLVSRLLFESQPVQSSITIIR